MVDTDCHVTQNLVRKALYFNYDHYRELGHHAFKNDEYILRLHVSKYQLSQAYSSTTMRLQSPSYVTQQFP